METNIEWYDAREVLPSVGEKVLVSGLRHEVFTCEETKFTYWADKDKYIWVGERAGDCYCVSAFQLWCHWPTVNDEGCVG